MSALPLLVFGTVAWAEPAHDSASERSLPLGASPVSDRSRDARVTSRVRFFGAISTAVRKTFRVSDEDDLLRSPGGRGVDEGSVEVARSVDGHDHERPLRALGLVHGDGVGELDKVAVGGAQPMILAVDDGRCVKTVGFDDTPGRAGMVPSTDTWRDIRARKKTPLQTVSAERVSKQASVASLTRSVRTLPQFRRFGLKRM